LVKGAPHVSLPSEEEVEQALKDQLKLNIEIFISYNIIVN
jgi:hypothetical protein